MSEPVDIEQIKAVYAETRSLLLTEERLGLGRGAVRRRLVKAGVEIAPSRRHFKQPLSDEAQRILADDSALAALYRKLGSQDGVAAELGVSRGAVKRRLKLAGTPIGPGGAKPVRLAWLLRLLAKGRWWGASEIAKHAGLRQRSHLIGLLAKLSAEGRVERIGCPTMGYRYRLRQQPAAAPEPEAQPCRAAYRPEPKVQPRLSLDAQIEALRRSGRTGEQIRHALRLSVHEAAIRGLIRPLAITDTYGNDPRSRRARD